MKILLMIQKRELMFTNGWMFWCIESVFACLPPMRKTLRGQHNALVCGYDKYWQCVWEKLSYCAGISRTVRCVNAKAKKKERQRTAEKQTNRQIRVTGRTIDWQQTTDDRFAFIFPFFSILLSLFYCLSV